jgi:predicted RNA-binding Zn ribbon-like protein
MECSLDLAVDLANTHDPATGRNDHLVDLRKLESFLADHQVSHSHRPSRSDLAQVWGLAATIREVFDATEQESAAKILNGLLAGSGARPELTNHDGEPWHLHYTATGTPLAPKLAAESAMALSVLIAEGEFERLRVCGGDSCVDVFVDQSRNRSRLYCSPQVCGNRASVAAFRARQRETRSSS